MKYYITGKAFASMILLLGLALTVTAYAGNQDLLTSLLIDLKGWNADKAEGMSMDMGAMKMINASRNYTKEASKIDAIVLVGSQAMAQAQASAQDMKLETADSRVEMKEIDGFRTQVVYDKKENTTAVVVFLAMSQTSGAMFSFSCKGIPEKEAMKLAKQFDWKKMKKVAEKLL